MLAGGECCFPYQRRRKQEIQENLHEWPSYNDRTTAHLCADAALGHTRGRVGPWLAKVQTCGSVRGEPAGARRPAPSFALHPLVAGDCRLAADLGAVVDLRGQVQRASGRKVVRECAPGRTRRRRVGGRLGERPCCAELRLCAGKYVGYVVRNGEHEATKGGVSEGKKGEA